ncbi:MAG: caspase family protein, partial [Desulfobacteria bacterium]
MKIKGNLISLVSVIFILLVGMAMTGCATTNFRAEFRTEVGVIGISKKLPLKAALYVSDTTKAYSFNAPIPLGNKEYHFGEHIERASLTAFLQVFEEISVVREKRNLDQFDIVIEPEFVKEKTRVNIAFSKIDVSVGVDYRVSDRDGVVFWQNVFVGDVTTGGQRTDIMKQGKALSKAVEEGALQMGRDFNSETIINRLYAKRTAPSKPMLEEKIEALSATPTVKSDVDELPVIKAKPNKNSYAIVIGIESYRQKLPKADYAAHDAKTMTEYLTKVMGYPEENVVTLTNDYASLTDFIKYFEKWLPNNVEKDSSVFIYYSGHGAPNTKTGDAYLVPYDGDPSFIEQTGYPLKKLYESLNKLQAKEIVVALDSCFSGAGGKSVIAKGARPLVMNLEQDIKLSKNMIVMSASSGDQISSTYDEKGHGLFTYFMLKGIKNEDVTRQDGSIKMDDLFG